MPKPVPVCKDCRHFYTSWIPNYTGGGGAQFERCKIKVPNLVLGGEGEPQCLISRYTETLCGSKGKWFEPKQEAVQ